MKPHMKVFIDQPVNTLDLEASEIWGGLRQGIEEHYAVKLAIFQHKSFNRIETYTFPVKNNLHRLPGDL